MKESIEKAIEGGALKVAGATGVAASVNSVFDWINTNASALGVIIAMLSLFIGWYYNHKRHDNEKTKLENMMLNEENKELKNELSTLSKRSRDK